MPAFARRAALIGVVLTPIVLASSAPALAQMESREGIALQNQILQLRRDLQTLQSQGGGGAGSSSVLSGPSSPRPLYPPPGAGGSDLTAQLLERVQALEEQVRQLRGQLDDLTYQSQRQNAETSKQLGDLSFSLQQGGGRTGGRSPSAPPPPPAPGASAAPPGGGADTASPSPGPAPASPTGHRTPEMTLQEGHAALARRDYAAAEATAREVLQGNRTSPRAYDAQLLLAQALAGQRNFSQAAIAYDDTYNRSRTGSHAAEALLGLANSLSAIGEKRAACETLTRLAAEFPRQGAEIRDGASAVRQRAGCH